MICSDTVVDQIKNAVMLQSLISAALLGYIIFRSNAQFRFSRLKRSMRLGGVSELPEMSRTDFVLSFISLAITFIACSVIQSVQLTGSEC